MTSPPFADLPLIDKPFLRDLRAALGEQRLNGLFASLQEEAGACLAGIERAVSLDDRDTLHFAAHKLKGIAQNLGLTRLGQAARVIEAAAKQSLELPISTPALAGILDETIQAIRAFAEPATP